MSYEDLLGGGAQTPEPETGKAQEKKQPHVKVTDLFEISNQTALKVAKDPKLFCDYLDLQSRFDRYGASNVLLLLAQRPDATVIGDYNSWQKKNVYIRKGEQSFCILDPRGKDYPKPDGSSGTRYAVKRMFDVSQTTYVKQPEPGTPVDERTLLQALIRDQSCGFVLDNDLPFGVCAEYRPQDRTIHVVQGLPGQVLFRNLAAQIALSHMEQGNDFLATSAAYLLCRTFRMQPPEIDIMPEEFTEMDSGQIRRQLERIKNAGYDLTVHMNVALKAIREKQAERTDGTR